MTSAHYSRLRGNSQSSKLHEYPEDVQKLASSINDARANNYQVSRLPTQDDSSLNQFNAYQIAAAVRAIRVEAGERPVGRKIGFTNRNIWPEYNIDASNWSYMYDRTTLDLDKLSRADQSPMMIDISEFSRLEPKIEPEIILSLRKSPQAGMTDVQLLDCIGWVSHGFEVVQSIFPGWKFTAADTTAAFALHGKLLVGQKIPTESLGSPEQALHDLKSFDIDLIRNGEIADRGIGANVLGSPINALRHLCELLEKDEWNPAFAEGEIITTGTLTRALTIEDGDTWKTTMNGLSVSGLECTFRTKTSP